MKTEIDERLEEQIADYALGLLEGEELEAFVRLMKDEPAVREQVQQWQNRLQPMADALQEQAPPADVWQNIQGKLGFEQATTEPELQSFWQRLNVWRSISAFGVAATFLLAVVLLRTSGEPNYVFIVEEAGVTEWVLKTSDDGRYLQADALQPPDMPPGKVCKLWVSTTDGGMHSLGELPMSGKQKFPVPENVATPKQGATVTVSIEDSNAETAVPIEKPTGRIVSSGKWISI